MCSKDIDILYAGLDIYYKNVVDKISIFYICIIWQLFQEALTAVCDQSPSY